MTELGTVRAEIPGNFEFFLDSGDFAIGLNFWTNRIVLLCLEQLCQKEHVSKCRLGKMIMPNHCCLVVTDG